MAVGESIVVGTDGSERAERAIERAGQLASALGTMVHVVSAHGKGPDGVHMAGAGEFGDAEVFVEDEKRLRAEHYVERARGRLTDLGVASEGHVWRGDPAEALVHIAEEQTAQMIVVGNRGMTGARRVLGSVPNSVSHHAPCDVLIVSTAPRSAAPPG
ncbi:MAG TPA: universal stress protein [Solirubrobacteraceae bacterium]|jgi:nucleotide-binding universal stress UspA family protein